MTHPERVEDYKAIRAIAEQAIAAQESAMVNPWRVLNLLDALTASEKRASEAVRERDEARAHLEKFYEKHIVELAQAANTWKETVLNPMQSQRDEARRKRDEIKAEMDFRGKACEAILNADKKLQSDRDEARAALGKVVEVATKVMSWADSIAQYVDDGMPVVPWAGELRTALTHTGKKEIKE